MIRGLAAMKLEKGRKLMSLGDEVIQAKGIAHWFTDAEAVGAGGLGGIARAAERIREHMARIGPKGGSR